MGQFAARADLVTCHPRDVCTGMVASSDIVLVLFPLPDEGAGLLSLLFRQRHGFPEVVFLVPDDDGGSAAMCLKALGVPRTLPMDRAHEWLDSALVPLATISRARRSMAQAAGLLPRVPAETAASSKVVPLRLAEGSFRESYLRSVLAIAGSRRRAARLAQVPYRTFNEMVRKSLPRGAP
jgi:hypothetical protein